MRLLKNGSSFLSSSISTIFWRPVVGLARLSFMTGCREHKHFARTGITELPCPEPRKDL